VSIYEDTVREAQLECEFGEFLREVYGETVSVMGLEYDTVIAIKALDPTAYEEAFSNYLDMEGDES
jgi:hypothetical protein